MSERTDAIERLLVVLKAEEALYQRMRDLLHREAEALAELDADGFAAIVREKEESADEGRLFEESRVAIVSELAAMLEFDHARPRLRDLCARLGPEAASLREAHNRLVIVVGIVQELVDANASLASQTLGHVKSTLELLGGSVRGAALRPGGTAVAEPGQLLRRSV